MQKKISVDSLKSRFQAGDIRALSQLISAAENQEPWIDDILAASYRTDLPGRVVGITGPPGAGKSTLLSELVGLVRAKGQRVAVAAVDPSSPFSGGSLLGDRIRLTRHFNDEGVYIRSLSTRGTLGGLSPAARQTVHLIQSFGFDWVFVETVGVGQNEIEIHKMADLRVVVLTPESGDSIQTLKAGLLEIADIFLVNKSDREGAEKLQGELRMALQLSGKDSLPVLMTRADRPEILPDVLAAFEKWFADGTELRNRRNTNNQSTLVEKVRAHIARELEGWLKAQAVSPKNPYTAFSELRQKFADRFLKTS